MSNQNFYHYEKCCICDGRGIIEIADEEEFTNVEQCPICLGMGTLKIKVEPNDID